jgi:RNA-directed DNA polymerase
MQKEFHCNNKKHASGTFQDWKTIDWKLVEKKVRSIQERIVKATKTGKHRKVKSLQWLLANSWYAKLWAIKRVTGNKGKNTPGIDRIVWSTPTDKIEAAKSLNKRGYKARPLRRVYIPKSNGKMRPLGIPTMKDRAMQALYLLALEPVAETTADGDSYGFRPERCCADAIEQCFNIFRGTHSAQWVLEADIKGCFDNISHNWLLDNIPMDGKILKQWLKAGFIDKKDFFASEEGTPQGGIISPVLANLTLDGMENYIYKACGSRERHKINFVRYADDFVISANNKTILEETILPAVIKFLEERGLEIQHEKTKISHLNTGFDFLGQNVRKYNGKLLIKPSKKSIKAIKRKVFDIIKQCNGTSAEMLIYQLNPVIRGWANYHRHIVSKVVFSKIDNDTYRALWRWAKRRHNNKNPNWIRKKYFKSIGNQNWVFAANYGKNKIVKLFKMESIPIKRFVKVRKMANPYDPEWYSYFDKRKSSRVRK